MIRLGLRVVLFCLIATACGAAAGVEPSSAPPQLDTLAPLPPSPLRSPEPATATSTTPTRSTTTTHPPKQPITLGFAGDTSFTHGLDARDPLADVLDLLQSPDLTAVNLETTVGEPGVGRPLDKTYIFRSPPRSVDLLVDAGVDVVSLANNHTLDYRRDGLLRTIELLDDGGLGFFGAGSDEAAAYAPLFTDVGDWRLGLVGFTHIECGWVADDPTRWPESAWACPGFEPRTIEAVEAASAAADFVVVMVHWGIEKDSCPQPYQRELAAAWVEAGADLIVGSHPHVLQGLEQIDGAWVVHSTGNFAFPSARQVSARSAFFRFEVSEHRVDVEVVPIRIVDGRPRVSQGDGASAILDDLGSWSFGWSFDAAGRPQSRSQPGTCG